MKSLSEQQRQQVKALAEDQPILGDASWIVASDPFAHQFAVPLLIPGTQKSKERGFELAIALGRMSPSDITRQIFHGDTWKDTSEFTGLALYFSTLDPSQAQCAVNVIDGGGRGRENASIYLILWSPQTVVMAISPDGFIDEDGKANVGIIPLDWRFIVRICNIDVHAEYPVDLFQIMQQAILRLPTLPGGSQPSPVFYMGQEVRGLLDRQWPQQESLRSLYGALVRVVDKLHCREARLTSPRQRMTGWR